MKWTTLFATAAVLASMSVSSHAAKLAAWQQQIIDFVDEKAGEHEKIAQEIGSLAELGYIEHKSSALLQEHLEHEGFKIEAEVAGIPTAFVASYGSTGPVIGIIAEFDALPGLSQAATPTKLSIDGQVAGHACGHHLLGTGAAEAAVAIKRWLVASGTKATVRVYGSPAEEGGGGKVYLTRAGLFDDVDAVMNWHPGDLNGAAAISSIANYSGKFRFRGVSAHAAAAPERGRSALDGVEAMNHMVNMMREHVPQESRIHYVITAGGLAPNVVPDFAEVYYYSRHPDPKVVASIWRRIEAAAKGAALGTGTTVEAEILNAVYPLLPNNSLATTTHRNLSLVGGVSYTEAETTFAQELSNSFGKRNKALASANQVQDLMLDTGYVMPGSTDVGDVSWVAPTTMISTATWVPGTPAHSWQAVAAGAMSIGLKGMHVASKTMALTAVELIKKPVLLAQAKAELERRQGEGFQYQSLIGDRLPPLDYRK